MTKKLSFILLPLLILLASCPDPSGEINITTVYWEPDGDGFVQFLTNDDQDCGYFFIHVPAGAYEATMTSCEVDVKKISGYGGAGFGVMFCGTNIDNFYKLTISLYGNYRVVKRVSGTYTELIPWSSSVGAINANHGVLNEIEVQFDGIDTFSIYFNNIFVDSFVDTSFSGGDCGFYASVSGSNENFPSTPADLRFRMWQPVVEP